jgi:type III restriction enzyme
VQFDIEALRDMESAKINCGRAHFKALASDDNPAFVFPARSLDDVFVFEPSST